MTFSLTPDQFGKLEAELLASHQVVLTDNTGCGCNGACLVKPSGTIATVDGKIAAAFTFDGATLDVTLTKHDGYPGFIANAGLKNKLNAAIKAL